MLELASPQSSESVLYCWEFCHPVVNIPIIKNDRLSIKLEEKINFKKMTGCELIVKYIMFKTKVWMGIPWLSSG